MIKMITSNILANNNNCNLNSPHSQSQHNDSGFDSGSSPELFHQYSNLTHQDGAPMSRTAKYRKVSKIMLTLKSFLVTVKLRAVNESTIQF